MPRAPAKPKRPVCQKGHPIPDAGYPCRVCVEIRETDQRFEETLRQRAPASMVIRYRDGRPSSYFHIPKHLGRRR